MHPAPRLACLAVLAGLLAACGDGAVGDDYDDDDDDDDDSAADAGDGPDAAPCTGDCGVTPLPRDGACTALSAGGDGTIAWRDATCLDRAMRLEGSVARELTYTTDGDTRTSTGVAGYDGMGYVVSHVREGDGLFSGGDGGTVTTPLDGAHHRIRRVRWNVPMSDIGIGAAGDPALVLTVDWFVATGRSHPVYAITFDLAGVPQGVMSGDSRAPYGELRFDGDRGGTVSGVGWGDQYRFVTLAPPLDKNNGWDYTAANLVPYAMEWIDEHDAEMGLVQTEPQARKAAGGYWGYGDWGTRDEDGPMPLDYNWPFQLNQYSFGAGETTASTRLAWGLNYGAVGDLAYAELGADPDNPPDGSPSGYPYQSYATYVVLGRHSDGAVAAQVRRVEVETTRTTVEVTTGAARTTGPAGAGRTDTVALEPAGYDPIYGVWQLDADGGALVATFHVGGDEPLESPIVAVHGASEGATVVLDGVLRDEDTDLHTSFDAATDTLWITFHSAWRGSVELAIQP
jgi:hypothetical protein